MRFGWLREFSDTALGAESPVFSSIVVWLFSWQMSRSGEKVQSIQDD